jgi:peptidoglycan hydrolase CwlO-like protein
MRPYWGAIMNMNTALGADGSKESLEVEGRRIFRELARGQAESGDVKTSADDLAALLHRLSDGPNREIERLINQLQNLRTQLQNAGNRIQRDIAEYAELSQQITQLTAIISDSVKKLPRGTRL